MSFGYLLLKLLSRRMYFRISCTTNPCWHDAITNFHDFSPFNAYSFKKKKTKKEEETSQVSIHLFSTMTSWADPVQMTSVHFSSVDPARWADREFVYLLFRPWRIQTQIGPDLLQQPILSKPISIFKTFRLQVFKHRSYCTQPLKPPCFNFGAPR